jgi:hypothetical protein
VSTAAAVVLLLIAFVALCSELMIVADPNIKNADDGDPFGPRPTWQHHLAYVSIAIITSVSAALLLKR